MVKIYFLPQFFIIKIMSRQGLCSEVSHSLWIYVFSLLYTLCDWMCDSRFSPIFKAQLLHATNRWRCWMEKQAAGGSPSTIHVVWFLFFKPVLKYSNRAACNTVKTKLQIGLHCTNRYEQIIHLKYLFISGDITHLLHYILLGNTTYFIPTCDALHLPV